MQPMLTIALRAARSAADIIMRAIPNVESLKAGSQQSTDFITQVNRAAEKSIIAMLQKTYPNHGFSIGKSGTVNGIEDGEDYLWIAKPLDAAKNFLRGVPQFAISIACQYKGKIEHAIVLDPLKDEAFGASYGYGAFLNNKRIRVSQLRHLEGAFLATAIKSAAMSGDFETHLNVIKSLMNNKVEVRCSGSVALDLAYVACGRFDAFFEFDLHQYDMAVGALLIQEAGGLCSDFLGGHNCFKSRQMISGNSKLLKELLKKIHPFVQRIS